MACEFIGNPSPLTASDFERAAASLECEVAALRAVAKVESLGSGFLRDGRPKILFERHKFHRFTGGQYSHGHPDISSPRAGGYLGGVREYDRLGIAMALDRDAALKSASWGAFQIMGFNHALAGFEAVEPFARAMASGSSAQLAAFVAFIRSQGLDRALREHDWPAFARGYNGADYRRNRYDARMASAYRQYSGQTAAPTAPQPVLRRGDRGLPVATLQRLLGVSADGIFGPQTRAAVRRVQASARLVQDGIVGPLTWRALRGA